MSTRFSGPLAQDMLDTIKATLDDGFLFIFTGTVPADANDALNMATTHTQLAKFTVADDGTTGLTFEVADDALLAKTGIEDWLATLAFDGFQDATPTLTPTFFRFVIPADTGRTLSTTAKRLQGTVGGPASTADLKLATSTLTEGNQVAVNSFNVRLNAIG